MHPLPLVRRLAASGDLEDEHQRSVIVDVVHDPVRTDPDAPGTCLSTELACSNTPRVFCQSQDGGHKPGLDLLWQAAQVPLGRRC